MSHVTNEGYGEWRGSSILEKEAFSGSNIRIAIRIPTEAVNELTNGKTNARSEAIEACAIRNRRKQSAELSVGLDQRVCDQIESRIANGVYVSDRIWE